MNHSRAMHNDLPSETVRFWCYALGLGFWILCTYGLFVWMAKHTAAHEAYDYRCCGERDCGPIADSAVHESGDVIVFRIAPGTHPMWPADKKAHLVVEVDRFRLEHRRIDGRWHICLNPALHVLCVYPPQRGF